MRASAILLRIAAGLASVQGLVHGCAIATYVPHQKKLVIADRDISLRKSNELERQVFSSMFNTADQRKDMRAFLENRPPKCRSLECLMTEQITMASISTFGRRSQLYSALADAFRLGAECLAWRPASQQPSPSGSTVVSLNEPPFHP